MNFLDEQMAEPAEQNLQSYMNIDFTQLTEDIKIIRRKIIEKTEPVSKEEARKCMIWFRYRREQVMSVVVAKAKKEAAEKPKRRTVTKAKAPDTRNADALDLLNSLED